MPQRVRIGVEPVEIPTVNRNFELSRQQEILHQAARTRRLNLDIYPDGHKLSLHLTGDGQSLRTIVGQYHQAESIPLFLAPGSSGRVGRPPSLIQQGARTRKVVFETFDVRVICPR